MEQADNSYTHEWLEKEAKGDDALLELLEEREALFSTDRADSDNDDRHDRMHAINKKIVRRKIELGIDPVQEP